MDKQKLDRLFLHCDEIYASYENAIAMQVIQAENSLWSGKRMADYSFGAVAGLYSENDAELLSLINQPCNHEDLIMLLKKTVYDHQNEALNLPCENNNNSSSYREIKEPLIEWIANHNYLLAYPMFKSKYEMLKSTNVEQVLSYVYIYLAYNFRYRILEKNKPHNFAQPNIEALYRDVFNKSSVFCKWGLIPVDEERCLFAYDIPARIYDSSLNKTVISRLPNAVARVLDELYQKQYVKDLALRVCDSEIHEGQYRLSILLEELEKGNLFSWNINELPIVTKLYSKNYEDCLWIIVNQRSGDITFEELCEDFHDDGNNIITQVVHIQYNENNITHIDHEYIYYDVDSYEARKLNPTIKGEARKRVKTFKVDNSNIPMNYPCKMFIKINDNKEEEVDVPFIFFILNSYFEHMDLLEEYFKDIM